jgi:glycosyltransferase involved in cell wall biosynthesis
VKVSIVTAVYNGASAIGATLDSVAAQDYADLEHVIIDGGSKDATLDVVRAKSARVGTLISERDAGVYDAFNKGLAHAKGEWIGFLGAGDRFADAHSVSRLIAAANAASADAVFSDMAIVADDGRVVRRYDSNCFSPRRIAYGYMPAHPTLLIRRSVYEKFGEYDTSYRIAGDFEFVARAFADGGTRFVHVPEILVLMQHGGLSNSGLRSAWVITREMRRACRQNHISTGWLRLLMRLPVKYLSEAFFAGRRASAG